MEQKNNILYSIYGVRKAKSNKGYVVTLIRDGLDGKREYANIYIPNDKVITEHADRITIDIKLLDVRNKEDDEKNEDIPF